MQKVTDFLEKNVQWVAIALGAIFALYMVYAKVLQSPIKATIGSDTYGPGEVSQHTADTVANELKGKTENRGTLKVEVADNAQKFKDAMSWKDAPPMQFAGGWDSKPMDLLKELQAPSTGAPGSTFVGGADPSQVVPKPTPGNAATGNDVTPPTPVAHNPMEKLPVPPVAQVTDFRVGRSVVLPVGQQAQGGNPANPNDPNAVPVNATDKDWVTPAWKISVDEIEKALKDAQIPAEFHNTAFLDVEVERQELDPNGNPVGQPTIVPHMPPPAPAGDPNAAPPPPPPGFPGAAASLQDKLGYFEWVNAQHILQPLFFTVVKGDGWAPPGVQLVADAQANQPFDPATTTLKPDQMTPEQKKAYFEWKQAETKRIQQEKAQQRKQAAPPRTPGGNRPPPGAAPGAGALYAPKDPTHYAAAATPRPAAAPRPSPRPGVPSDGAGVAPGAPPGVPPGAYPGASPGAVPPPVPTGPLNVAPTGGDIPTGEFKADDPQWAGKTITTWTHDTNVKPGKTYKYRMRYRLKNPIFQVFGNIAKDPKLTQQLAIESDWSAWTNNITVPAIVNFYVVNGIPETGPARFEVFTWNHGVQHSETFQAFPGDEVGGPKGDKDFATGWTVVSFQKDARTGQTQALLVDAEGHIVARSFGGDQSDPLYKTLKNQVAAAKQAEAAATGTPGVTPTGAPVLPTGATSGGH